MLAVADESQDFRDRGVFSGKRLHALKPFGEDAGTMKQLVIE